MNAAIAGAVGFVLEARFSNGPVGRDERRKDVARELQISRHAEQGIRSRARATDGRLRMAARAAHEVEARSDAVGDGLFLGEIRMPGGERAHDLAHFGSGGHLQHLQVRGVGQRTLGRGVFLLLCQERQQEY